MRGPSGSSYSLGRGTSGAYIALSVAARRDTVEHATERVKVYVDGFNLYHGMREKYGRRYLWLDLEALVRSLLHSNQTLVGIDYFTARVRKQPDSELRQAVYLDALAGHSQQITIVEGRFQEKTRFCRSCRTATTLHEEKETDVSIAAALIEDAVNDVFDAAMLVSADSDLCPAIRAVGRLRPDKRIFAAFPPARTSGDLRNALNRQVFTIGHTKLRNSLLPESLTTSAGVVLSRPPYWK
jgi:uncharacterized LabA/DUF88 family protein